MDFKTCRSIDKGMSHSIPFLYPLLCVFAPLRETNVILKPENQPPLEPIEHEMSANNRD